MNREWRMKRRAPCFFLTKKPFYCIIISVVCRCGEIGRHEGLKIPFWRQSTGSTPVGGIKRPPKLTLEGLFILLILHLAAVQLCIHLGTALGHSRGHVHIVLMRALQTQFALPGLLGELLCNVGLLLCDRRQLNGQLTIQHMRHQQLFDLGGGNGDGALDGIGVQIDHRDGLARLDDFIIHGDQVTLGLTIFIVEAPRHLLARNDGLAGGIRALHLGSVAAVRLLDRLLAYN